VVEPFIIKKFLLMHFGFCSKSYHNL